ncbi:uncharacterized protein LOC129569598 isoform X2 [Sitodiplosis mosellana]|uniref:uncharacterized protein LOC129569598 isoform X2 n=1 Tax=Sitodiplosis mosellana TaxID=263140 RepID=UPI0024441C08|nr:uncharacterized protein LOC129569598 isoform X2 [Sitodiplosis mosellana]
MTRLFSKSALVLATFLYFNGVYPSVQANVSPKVDFVEDNNSEHVPPKIQGVRVIVDATKMNGGKMDDKTETIRIQTDGAKQTVGIHTDITFELDDKKNGTKKTDGKNAESDEDIDDTEVPVYRGSHTEGANRNNFNRRYDPNDYYQANFHGTNDDFKYADAGTWVRFLPMANGGWTTERSKIPVWWICTVWYWTKIIQSTVHM